MKNLWICWIVSLIITMSASLTNRYVYRVEQIIKLEFAPSADSMRTYIEGIDNSSKEHSYYILKKNTEIDFIFLIGYTLLTFFSIAILLSVFDVRPSGWVYVISILPGFFDCLENIVLMSSAIRQREDFSWLYCDIVRIKWAFAIVPFMVIPIVIIYGSIVLFRSRH